MKIKINAAVFILTVMLLISCSIGDNGTMGIIMKNVFHRDKALFLLEKVSRLQFHLGKDLKVAQDFPVLSKGFLYKDIDQSYQKASAFINRDLMSEFSFVNYVLPYKLNSAAPMEWRTRALGLYTVSVGRTKSCVNPDSMLNICNDIDRYTKTLIKYKLDDTNENFLSLEDILAKGSGSCLAFCSLNAYVCRANGLPVTFDYVPAWGNQDGGHAWNVLVPNEKDHYPISAPDSGSIGSYNPLSFIISSQSDDIYSRRVPPKIYRKGFIPDTTSVYLRFNKQLSNIGTTFTDLDVTAQYVMTADVNTQYYIKNPADLLVLRVLNSGTWRPVSAISPKLKEFSFRDVGVENLYLISSPNFEGESFLFYLDKSGNIRDFRSPKKNRIVLNRDRSVFQQQLNYIDRYGWTLPNYIKDLPLKETSCLSDKVQYNLYGLKNGKWEILEKRLPRNGKITSDNEYADGLYIILAKSSKINAKTRPFILLDGKVTFI